MGMLSEFILKVPNPWLQELIELLPLKIVSSVEWDHKSSSDGRQASVCRYRNKGSGEVQDE